MKTIRVVLVDNHRLVRQGLRAILDPDPRFQVVGEAAGGADALRAVSEQQPDAVLLDLKLSDANGASLCRPMLEASPDTAVVILTAFIDRSLVDACLRAGASGYLLKDAETLNVPEQILNAIEGHTALDPRAADILVSYVREHEPPADALIPREIDVLRLVAQGLTSKEIALQLSISEHTVKGHVKEILSKLDVHSRVQAALLARGRGLI
jgi:DNA-binding NarL/FixJ family response regulator